MASLPARFSYASGSLEAARIRRYETLDLAKRLAVIRPDAIRLINYPRRNPFSVFNASAHIEGKELKLYMRIIVGYYRYVSAIALGRLIVSQVLAGELPTVIDAKIIINPSNRYDVWGTEDPRVYEIGGRLYMTFSGRTIDYFKSDKPHGLPSTLPVTAVSEDGGYTWSKRYVHITGDIPWSLLRSDKDAFMYGEERPEILFHRPHVGDGGFVAVASRVEEGDDAGSGLRWMVARKPTVLLTPAPFEYKVGWSTPPIRVGRDLLLLAHGVDMDGFYRVFALLLEYSRSEGFIVKAITPRYIMEPRETYEVYGDRPYVVFPCGAVPIGRSEILISYGAADSFVGLAVTEIDGILSELDRGRIY
ncbi:hypothetical protein CF15_03155 [Pyrodictium occultum]|uniref:Glycosidase n=1 Tax=Pyrodictium occultum TaxID=2309 RepID=A0A0V8RUS3_PYROC|nr:hypothetical protein [Pyrodictium occultum]KSW11814.1 hypothetical protein CF15_03155 [Pyrodictium occultum]